MPYFEMSYSYVIFFYRKKLLLIQLLPPFCGAFSDSLSFESSHLLICVSHFSSCMTLRCVCLPPRVGSEFESISPSVHGSISINSSWSVLWQYSQCWPFSLCHNLLCNKSSEWGSHVESKVITLITSGH